MKTKLVTTAIFGAALASASLLGASLAGAAPPPKPSVDSAPPAPSSEPTDESAKPPVVDVPPSDLDVVPVAPGVNVPAPGTLVKEEEKGRIVARAKLSTVDGKQQMLGDARFYEGDKNTRVSLSLTQAAVGTYGVYLGSDCSTAKMPQATKKDRARGSTQLKSQLLLGKIVIGTTGIGSLDAPIPAALATRGALGSAALMVMPERDDEPSLKLACGRVLVEPAPEEKTTRGS